MIPKVIHYCWFGGKEKSKLAKKCIKSWKEFCPDYKIIEWNEKNFDVYMNEYTRFCYENKKWAFLSDFVRLSVIAENGGIYFDTDVEVIRSFDTLLQYDAFYCFENEKYIASGLGFGAIAHHATVIKMLAEYLNLKIGENNNFELIGCPILNTKALLNFGFILNGKCQLIDNIQVLSSEYLNPYEDSIGILSKTKNTYSIHWSAKSALSLKDKFRSKITRPFHRLFGVNCFSKIKYKLKK